MIDNISLWPKLINVKKPWVQIAIYLLCLSSLSIVSASDERSINTDLYAIRANGKIGYIASDGTVIIPPQYDDGSPFSDGRAWVYMNGKAILIDGAGQVIAQANYDNVHPFRDGFSVVGRNMHGTTTGPQDTSTSPAAAVTQWGYVDRKGNPITDTIYYNAQPFHEGVAIVAVGNRKENDSPLAGIKFAVIDTSGKYLIEPGDRVFAGEMSEGLIPASTEERDVHGSPTKWGYIDKHGNWAIKPRFSEARTFHQGLAAVAIRSDSDNERPIQRWGYINRAEVLKIAAEWDQAGDFSEGLAPVVKWIRGDSGPQFLVKYINPQGETILEPKGVLAHEFKYGIAIVTLSFKPLQNYLIDPTGRQLFPGTHEIFVIYESDVIFVQDRNRMEYRTKNGALIWSSQ